MPNIGYLFCKEAKQELILKNIEGHFYLENNHSETPCSLVPVTTINHSKKVELIYELPDLYKTDFKEYYKGQLKNENPDYDSTKLDSKQFLENTYALFQKHYFSFYQVLNETTKAIFVHNNSKVLNYVSFPNHGIIYLYMLKDASLAYFIEELLHQGAHNLFGYFVF